MATSEQRKRHEAARLGVLLRIERELQRSGLTRIAGVDEVGVGPLAGPVIAAAVILPVGSGLRGVDDSKKVTARRREQLAAEIRSEAVSFAFGVADVEEIDRINIYQAALLAMRRAVEALEPVPEHVVVDARTIPGVAIPQTSLIKGDARCYSIAAASILAKVERDKRMAEYDLQFPGYGFGQHAGYGTAKHLAAIAELGPCPIHRRSFAPLRAPRLPGL